LGAPAAPADGARYKYSPRAFDENPVDVFLRNVFVHPFHEEDPIGLVKLLGADHVLFGSDYPHPEGWPTDRVRGQLGALPRRRGQGDGRQPRRLMKTPAKKAA